ncbi:MAG: methionine--tRNA ligase [Candidatus Paceibacterota bacterium]|jgi:methionyl-tRNA synthetase
MSKKDKRFYITTTLPYVNADPHVGFALEFIRADIIARFRSSLGEEVFFNTGTDEHGIKIFRKAEENGLDPQTYVDGIVGKFKNLIPLLNILPNVNFIRTTDKHHVLAAQEFWKIADKNGLIYKKNYSVKYCVGCELEKTDSELIDDKCPLHPSGKLEIIKEENYFFRFSIYQKPLLDLYEKNPTFVVPRSRLNEIQAFVERGLEDFSISRLASKMPWGIPVPGDEKHVMYVWFDALVNYISAVGWPHSPETFSKWWVETGGVVQYCGKDNLRQQAAMWQAMLMSVKLPPSKQIIIDGFVTGEGGVKMSKSLGNTIDPMAIVDEFGADALRYYVARELSPFEDSPFTLEKFKESYNAHLANGLGNLVSRILKMAETNNIVIPPTNMDIEASPEIVAIQERYVEGFDGYDIQRASNAIWDLISATDKIVQVREPFKKIKVDKDGATADIVELLVRLRIISRMLLPILPATSIEITKLLETNKMPTKPLFARK